MIKEMGGMMLLETIHSPEDVRALPYAELPKLAQEIRDFLIQSLSETGGHLAPNLGVVELTLALHRVFHSPHDKLIWDIGHQGYVHKLLTGRREAFSTLRQFGGLSGFLKRSESEHDIWEAGHSSTSLSAAQGMAIARDLKGETYHVVAVIGDGALTGGMALEALNHIGHEKRPLIIVLNDNEMSISPNVGAIHHYLGRIRTAGPYQWAKDEFTSWTKRIPGIGESLFKTAERMKDAVKKFFVPGMLFEELGLTYLGPVNGHDLDDLETTFNMAKKIHGPVLVHVLTVKGRGYPAAERDADTYHGLGPYKIESGEMIKVVGPPSYSSVFAETMIELAERDQRLVVITPAMISGSGLKPFQKQFPNRLFDVGIAEQHALTMAGGLASAGMRPVVSIYSTFLQRAYDQLIHDLAIQKLPVVLAIDRAGLVGADGETHQGVFDIPALRTVPNVVLSMPKDERELRDLLYTAFKYESGVFAVRYPRGSATGLPYRDQPFQTIPLGTWEKLEEGHDLAFLAVGQHMLDLAKRSATRLLRHGFTSTIINARFIKPLDIPMLESLSRTHRLIITLEESSLAGGFGSAVMETLESLGLPMHVLRFGIPDHFVEQGSHDELLLSLGLVPEHIESKVLKALKQTFKQVQSG